MCSCSRTTSILVATIAILLAWAYGPGLPASQSELTAAYQNKRVVVCGSSYGIGAEIAKDLAKSGAHLFLSARSKNKLEGVAKECTELGAASVHIFPVDLSTRQGSKAMIEAATSKMGGIDVLVLNHIIGMYDDWAAHLMNGHASGEIDQSMDWVDKLFKVNILSYIYISSYALPELAESGSGRIIAVGSMAGRQGLARVAPYASTKHAMFGYFDSLRQDILASPDPKVRSIGITTGVLGAFSTETARAGTAGKLDDGMVVSEFFFFFFLLFFFCLSSSSFFFISFFFFFFFFSSSSSKPWNDPSVASHDLIKAGAREWQTVYTPWHQLRIAALLHGFAPELMEKIILHVTLSGEVKK